jgi:hypothetical protein
MKDPFRLWQSGIQTLHTFEQMVKVHDLTFMLADRKDVWKAGHDEFTLICEAAIQLGTDARTVWNAQVLEKLDAHTAQSFMW